MLGKAVNGEPLPASRARTGVAQLLSSRGPAKSLQRAPPVPTQNLQAGGTLASEAVSELGSASADSAGSSPSSIFVGTESSPQEAWGDRGRILRICVLLHFTVRLIMAEAGRPEDQREDSVGDEFNEIIKTRSGTVIVRCD
ncbi:UNVERIFIED_CONTAM: hypothetical protein FKN15_032402 [Acipenser sinensis]